MSGEASKTFLQMVFANETTAGYAMRYFTGVKIAAVQPVTALNTIHIYPDKNPEWDVFNFAFIRLLRYVLREKFELASMRKVEEIG